MRSPLGTPRRADQLARLLDGPAPAAGVPDGPLATGVAVATRLRTAGTALAPAAAPRPEFRDALRTRLLAVAAVQGVGETAAPARTAASSRVASLRATKGLGVAAGAMASVVAVSGVAAASSMSLPGDPFYGVKRTTEGLQLRVAGGPVDTGSLHLDLAATRLREVRALTLGRDAAGGPRGGPPVPVVLPAPADERVQQALVDMDEATVLGSDLLTAAYREHTDAGALEVLSRFAARQSSGLTDLLPALPEATRARAQVSLALVDGVGARADDLLRARTCPAGCDPTRTAPGLPGSGPDGTGVPCTCPPAEQPASPRPTPAPSPDPAGSRAPSPTPAPQPAPDGADPAPPPAPAPTPTPSRTGLPGLPLPTLPLPTGTPLAPVAPLTDPLAPLVDPLLDPLAPLTDPVAPLTDPLVGPLRGSSAGPDAEPSGGVLGGLLGSVLGTSSR